jgi:hypothetical protein
MIFLPQLNFKEFGMLGMVCKLLKFTQRVQNGKHEDGLWRRMIALQIRDGDVFEWTNARHLLRMADGIDPR